MRLHVSSTTRRLCPLLLAACSACGGQQGAADAGETSTTDASDDETDDETDDGGESDDTEETSGSSGAADTRADSGSTGEAAPLEVDVEVRTHPGQPMVVDLLFSQPGLALEVHSPLDAGVRVGSPEQERAQTSVRVRGLTPATAHVLEWEADDGAGRRAEGEVDFTTLPPLPGFMPSFEVRGDPSGMQGLLLFDLVGVTETAPSSLFVVDTSGTPRWHVGRTNAVLQPSMVYAAAKLRDDGSVIFLQDYAITALDELGAEVFSLDSASVGVPGLHHDFEVLPSGNLLTMSYVFRHVDDPELGTISVAGDLLLEVTPEGEVVWSWDMFDHLDLDRRPPGFEEQVIDPTTGASAYDWTHSNGIVDEPQTGSVLVSVRHQDWLVRVDRETGEVVWRLGPEGDFALSAGTWFHHQHSPQWQDDGSLLLYDNGLHDPAVDAANERSRAVRYVLDEQAMTAEQVWEDGGDGVMVPIAGDADRVADGSVLITDSSIDFGIGAPYAEIRKVDESAPGRSQWSLTTAVPSFVYRCVEVSRLVGGE